MIVKANNEDPKKEDINSFLEDKVAKWWLPDDIVFVDELPHTATGKLLKTDLRDEYKEYLLNKKLGEKNDRNSTSKYISRLSGTGIRCLGLVSS